MMNRAASAMHLGTRWSRVASNGRRNYIGLITGILTGTRRMARKDTVSSRSLYVRASSEAPDALDSVFHPLGGLECGQERLDP